jgi:hypothetical protein
VVQTSLPLEVWSSLPEPVYQVYHTILVVLSIPAILCIGSIQNNTVVYYIAFSHMANRSISRDVILQYVYHKQSEYKIAGIKMINSFLLNPKLYAETDNEQLISEVLHAVDPSFLIGILELPANDLRNIPIQNDVLTFFAHACSFPSSAKLLSVHIARLVKVWCSSVVALKADILVVVKLVVLCCEGNCRNEAVSVVLANKTCRVNTCVDSALSVLKFIAEITTNESTCGSAMAHHNPDRYSKMNLKLADHKNILLQLTSGAGLSLQGLFVQCLHGAAPQWVHDETLTCLRDLLKVYSKQDERNQSSLSYGTWSTETDGVGHKVQPETKPVQSFPLFIVSMVRCELQLLCDELLFLSSNSPKSLAEKHYSNNADKGVQLHSKKSVSTAVNTATTDSASSVNASDGVAENPTNGTSTQAMIDADISFFQSRSNRAVLMSLVCYDLLVVFLGLLIGEPNGDSPGLGPWACLEVGSLLSIKNVVYGTLDDLFGFIKDCGEYLKTAAVSTNIEADALPFLFDDCLKHLVCCVVDVLSEFCVQDVQLWSKFIASIPSCCLCSSIAVHSTEMSEKIKSAVYNCQVDFRYGGLSLALCIKASGTSGKNQLDISVNSDVVLHLFGPLRALLECAVKNEDDAQDSEDVGCTVSASDFEQLFDKSNQLLNILLTLTQLVANWCVTELVFVDTAENSESAHRINLISAFRDMVELFLIFFQKRQQLHPGDFSLLFCGEGYEAFVSIFGVHCAGHVEKYVNSLQKMHVFLHSAQPKIRSGNELNLSKEVLSCIDAVLVLFVV